MLVLVTALLVIAAAAAPTSGVSSPPPPAADWKLVTTASPPPPAADWKLVTTGLTKASIGLSAANATTVYLAGGGGTIAQGSFVGVSSDGGKSWTAIDGVDEQKIMFANVVKASPSTGNRYAAGVSLFKDSVAFSSSGSNVLSAFKPSTKKDTFSTQSLEVAHGRVFLTSEWNHYSNGSVCSTPASGQCSGVLVADEKSFPGAQFEHVDWRGTDEPGVDARYGAFPSPTTWYVAGGSWPSGDAASAAATRARGGPSAARVLAQRTVNRRSGPLDGYRALITKTTDGGKSWKTVFNDTGFNETFAFYFNQIACVDEDTCWAAAECPGTECGSYGAFIYHTADGGSTWKMQHYAYEVSLLKLVAVSKTKVIAAGGSVGMSFGGILVETSDGGATWEHSSLKGHGYVFGIDMLPDGSAGYAVTCSSMGMGSASGLWRYEPSATA